jgi:hypothetical protein
MVRIKGRHQAPSAGRPLGGQDAGQKMEGQQRRAGVGKKTHDTRNFACAKCLGDRLTFLSASVA